MSCAREDAPSYDALIYNQTQTIIVPKSRPNTRSSGVRSDPAISGVLWESTARRSVQRRSWDCWSLNVSVDRRDALSNRVPDYKTDWTHGSCHSTARRTGASDRTWSETPWCQSADDEVNTDLHPTRRTMKLVLDKVFAFQYYYVPATKVWALTHFSSAFPK